jgi:1,4-alpha-glucan branching enzyme
VKDLNIFYKNAPALYEKAFSYEGFEWINFSDHQNSVIVFIRKGHDTHNDLIVACNFTQVPRKEYRIGLPRKGTLMEVFNSDKENYYGGGMGNDKPLKIEKKPYDNKPYSVEIVIPPLAAVYFSYK